MEIIKKRTLRRRLERSATLICGKEYTECISFEEETVVRSEHRSDIQPMIWPFRIKVLFGWLLSFVGITSA